jgi:hypothetical protein
MQDECEGRLLQGVDLRTVRDGRLEHLTLWAAAYDPNGLVHLACCQELCNNLPAARDAGMLERIAQHASHITASVIAGMFVSLDSMVRHAMESGMLSDCAGLSAFPTDL